LLGTVMREHRKTNSAITKPTLYWGRIVRWEPYVTFNYPGGGVPENNRYGGTLPFMSVHHTSPEIERLTLSRTSPYMDREYPVLVDFDQIKRWVTDCEVGHSKCRLVTKKRVKGLRLIDCKKRTVVPAQRNCQYAALSYVWGNLDTGPSVEHGILPTNLPRTIEDSILATRLLGYRYLWIDKYVSTAV
jgi:hypothetical protein